MSKPGLRNKDLNSLLIVISAGLCRYVYPLAVGFNWLARCQLDLSFSNFDMFEVSSSMPCSILLGVVSWNVMIIFSKKMQVNVQAVQQNI